MKHTRYQSLWLPLVASLSFGVGLGFSEALHPQQVGAQNSQAQTLSQLNQDFIGISERVTPAVVSIAMTKNVKTQNPRRLDPQVNPHDFYDFFGLPFPQAPGQERRQEGVGSGVIVDAEKGYVLTNNHVVEGADEIKVTLNDRRNFKARIVGTDPRSDLAVIQLIEASELKQVVIGDSGQLHVGEWVLAIGNPFGLDSTVTAGIISAKGRANVGVADFEDFIQTDAAINPGNSGGALVNIKGELIGINTAIATRSRGYMGVGFAIPSNMAQQVMKSLIAQGKVSRSQLGIYIQPLDNAMAENLGLKDSRQGILVSGIIKGSPAEKVGARKYDVVTGLNGKAVQDVNQFRNTIALLPPGTQVELELVRNGEKITLKPLLTEATTTSDRQTEASAPEASVQQDLSVQELTPALRSQLGLPEGLAGVVVAQVNPSSTAYEKGVRPGDLITEINRKPVRSEAEFKQLYGSMKSGESVLLAIQRQGGQLIIAYRIP